MPGLPDSRSNAWACNEHRRVLLLRPRVPLRGSSRRQRCGPVYTGLGIVDRRRQPHSKWGTSHNAEHDCREPITLRCGLTDDQRQGENPLRGSVDDAIAAIELCLERGLDVNAVSASGDSAIHAALGSPKLIRFLVQRNARLDLRNKQGRTPLEAAISAREPNAASIAVLKELTEVSLTQPAAEPTEPAPSEPVAM